MHLHGASRSRSSVFSCFLLSEKSCFCSLGDRASVKGIQGVDHGTQHHDLRSTRGTKLSRRPEGYERNR